MNWFAIGLFVIIFKFSANITPPVADDPLISEDMFLDGPDTKCINGECESRVAVQRSAFEELENSTDLHNFRKDVLILHNTYRKSYGMKPLTLDNALNEMACQLLNGIRLSAENYAMRPANITLYGDIFLFENNARFSLVLYKDFQKSFVDGFSLVRYLFDDGYLDHSFYDNRRGIHDTVRSFVQVMLNNTNRFGVCKWENHTALDFSAVFLYENEYSSNKSEAYVTPMGKQVPIPLAATNIGNIVCPRINISDPLLKLLVDNKSFTCNKTCSLEKCKVTCSIIKDMGGLSNATSVTPSTELNIKIQTGETTPISIGASESKIFTTLDIHTNTNTLTPQISSIYTITNKQTSHITDNYTTTNAQTSRIPSIADIHNATNAQTSQIPSIADIHTATNAQTSRIPSNADIHTATNAQTSPIPSNADIHTATNAQASPISSIVDIHNATTNAQTSPIPNIADIPIATNAQKEEIYSTTEREMEIYMTNEKFFVSTKSAKVPQINSTIRSGKLIEMNTVASVEVTPVKSPHRARLIEAVDKTDDANFPENNAAVPGTELQTFKQNFTNEMIEKASSSISEREKDLYKKRKYESMTLGDIINSLHISNEDVLKSITKQRNMFNLYNTYNITMEHPFVSDKFMRILAHYNASFNMAGDKLNGSSTGNDYGSANKFANIDISNEAENNITAAKIGIKSKSSVNKINLDNVVNKTSNNSENLKKNTADKDTIESDNYRDKSRTTDISAETNVKTGTETSAVKVVSNMTATGNGINVGDGGAIENRDLQKNTSLANNEARISANEKTGSIRGNFTDKEINDYIECIKNKLYCKSGTDYRSIEKFLHANNNTLQFLPTDAESVNKKGLSQHNQIISNDKTESNSYKQPLNS